MTHSDQARKPAWVDDDNWTSQKTDWEFDYLLQQMDYRPLEQREREWILTLIPNHSSELL